MLDSSHVELSAVCVHRIGNKLRQEGIEFSSGPLKLTPSQVQPLLYFFFNHFEKVESSLRLSHPVGLKQNAIFAISSCIFKAASLVEESRKAAEHLYDVSDHPKINAGNLYVAYFRNVRFDGKPSDAVGYFKSDHIDQFLNVDISGGKTTFSLNAGTRIKSFDKGALILNRNAADGLRVFQAVSHSDEALFWTAKFLKTQEVADSGTHTRDLLHICKKYSDSMEESSDPTAKARFLDSTYSYFSDNGQFSEGNFLAAIPTESRESFSNFYSKQKDDSELNIPSDFAVARSIVKKQKAKFRAVIRLDDRIEIKIHPNLLADGQQSIERGYDTKLKKNFYKIYYTEES